MPVASSVDTHNLPSADRGRRVLAFVVDGPVVWGLTFLVSIVWATVDPVGFDTTVVGREKGLAILLYGVYVIPCWAVAGTSVGKWLFGLKLIGPADGSLGFLRALVRFVVMATLSGVLALPWWPVLIRRDRRGLHDLAAGTRLVQTVPTGPGFLR